VEKKDFYYDLVKRKEGDFYSFVQVDIVNMEIKIFYHTFCRWGGQY